MDVRAIAKDIRISPIKLRLMADLIRGKDVSQAKVIVNNYVSKPARIIKKVLDSAVANAVNNNSLDETKLYVKEIRVDMASTLKKMHPGSRGSYDKRYHRHSHVTIVVAERES